MLLLCVPSIQCSFCFVTYDGIVTDDKQYITFTHPKQDFIECSHTNETFQRPISNFLKEI
jgi:hypothetical protein